MSYEVKYNLLVSYIKGMSGVVNEIYDNNGEINMVGLMERILLEVKYLDGLENTTEIQG